MPYISHALQDDLAALQELGAQLPEVGRQVRHIRQAYDRGRDKVRAPSRCESHGTCRLTFILCRVRGCERVPRRVETETSGGICTLIGHEMR